MGHRMDLVFYLDRVGTFGRAAEQVWHLIQLSPGNPWPLLGGEWRAGQPV